MGIYNILIMVADLIFIGLFVWLYFVVFDDTEKKDTDRKKRIDAICGVNGKDKNDSNT